MRSRVASVDDLVVDLHREIRSKRLGTWLEMLNRKVRSILPRRNQFRTLLGSLRTDSTGVQF